MNYDDLASKRDLWKAISDLTLQIIFALMLVTIAIIVLMVVVDRRLDQVEARNTEYQVIIVQPEECPRGLTSVEFKQC